MYLGRKSGLIVFVLFFCVLWVFSAAAEDKDSNCETLKGINVVVLIIDDLTQEIESAGLTTRDILNDIQQKCQDGGISVLDTQVPGMAKKLGPVWLKEGGPYLHVRPNFQKTESEKYAYSISFELCQTIVLERDDKIQTEGGVTWSISSFGIAKDISEIRNTINEQILKFLSDHKSVNN